MKPLLLATSNKHKIEEISAILELLGLAKALELQDRKSVV